MFVKLRGYGSNRENASKGFKMFTKAMPIIAESQFPWSKNSISMPFDTRVRGDHRTYKFILTYANFRPLWQPATLLSSIGVSHKLKSGTEL